MMQKMNKKERRGEERRVFSRQHNSQFPEIVSTGETTFGNRQPNVITLP